MLAASLNSPCTVVLVRSASDTAFCAIAADCATWRPISVTELASSSDAAATVCTFVDASSVAAATAVAWLLVSSAVAVIDDAVACSSVEADATDLSTVEIFRIERLGQIVHPRRTRHARADGFGFLGGKLLGLDHVLLEDQDRSRHQADFVLLVGCGNLDGVIAAGKLPHGADHLQDRRHDRTVGQIDDGGGDADADAHQHPEQGHQETGFGENRRTVRLQTVLLPRNHAARTRARGVLRAREDIEQLVGAGRGFVGQEPLRHVPAVRGPDLEHSSAATARIWRAPQRARRRPSADRPSSPIAVSTARRISSD